MARSVARQLIDDHLVSGTPEPGAEIGLRIDQTLTQDATGTLVMLALEAMETDQVATEVSAQYVDHNLLQQDHRNQDDHLFLHGASRRFGVWYSRAGTGVSHPVHMNHLGVPGKTLLGSDSHTPAAGSLGMLAFGAGGLDVATAMRGEPYHLVMPTVWGVRLTGALPPWVSAKDVVLELLRRHGVSGGRGRILEFFGPGLAQLSAMDRHVIANMGTELGATTTVFPSDDETRRFLALQDREDAWREIVADPDARYDLEEELDLSGLVPLVARPSSPGDVVPVEEVAGAPIHQAYLGSSANPGYRDFAVPALMVRGRRVHEQVSFDVNPTTRQLVATLARDGLLGDLLAAGARLHQAGCNGCIGMGQAPATGRNSLRTTPRNFPGRSGTIEDSVWLCSPETATASALTGVLTDPRTLEMEPPRVHEPHPASLDRALLLPPLPAAEARRVEIPKGPNIAAIPPLDPLPDELAVPVILTLGDDVSTDEILPAGARVLPFRSNIPAIARFAFAGVDESYPDRADEVRGAGGHAIMAGDNYGQGSSREHAALAPRHLGLRVVLAASFARIHRQNLINFGVLPLTLVDPSPARRGATLELAGLHDALSRGSELELRLDGQPLRARHDLSERERDVLRAGGVIGWLRGRS